MSILDRIFGRKTHVTYSVSVNSDLDEPPPHNFCSRCGEPMVDGYMVLGRGFDKVSGSPVKRILRDRMCIAYHGKDYPEPVVKDDETFYPGSTDHDGFPFSGYWGDAEHDEVPDCLPRKKAGA